MSDIINDNTPIIPISTAADILGIHTRTLMLYEFEKVMIPKRNPQNRRIYSQNDIRKIRFIRYLTQRKRLNFAGVRIVLKFMEKSKNPEFIHENFADFRG